MTSAASARTDLYARFARHNRRIGMLRWAVPVAGAAILALPAVEIAVSIVADALPVAGLRLENDTLVIEGPRFEGRTATGTNYAMTAARAESRVGNLDTADLHDLEIDIAGAGDYSARVEFSSATWTMSTEYLTSNEDVYVADSTGARGVLAGVAVDWPNQTIASDGPVRFSFENGAELFSDTMVYDLEGAAWRFTGVTLDMVPKPDAGAERDPLTLEVPDASFP